jgi:tetratricopeptide (TPR) repeat protein
MRFPRLGIFVLLILAVFLTTNCSYYNRIMSRKNLVDGSLAYKERKFDVAEELFRKAAGRDPQGLTEEGKIAQTFLARTLHSRYIGDRKQTFLAEEAIKEYKKSLSINKNDQSSYKAIASLYENLQRPDDWLQWVTERSNAADIKPEYRAEALTSLAAKQNTCANEISDTEATKKTVKKDGKDVFQFTKPANAADFDKLKGCVTEGNKLIEQAVALEPETVKNAGSFNAKTATDDQLKTTLDAIKPFESARSYRASLIIQASRVAEMEGRDADHDKLKTDADKAKADFVALSDVGKSLQIEMDSRNAIKAEEANSNKANNATKK